jgi:hypothetical protein
MHNANKSQDDEVRLHLRVEQVPHELSLSSAPGCLDDGLKAAGAQGLVFLPLLPPGRPSKPLPHRKVAKARAQVQGQAWHSGSIQHHGATGQSTPAVYSFQLDTTAARVHAEALGLEIFYSICSGGALQSHEVTAFAQEPGFDLENIQASAREGSRAIWKALLGMRFLPQSTMAAGSQSVYLGVLALLIIGFGLIMNVLFSTGWVVPARDHNGQLIDNWEQIMQLLHPIVLPTLVVGLYMRWVSRVKHPEVNGALSPEQAATQWNYGASHRLVVWLLLLLGVALLGSARAGSLGELGNQDWMEDVTLNYVIALWLLGPLAYSRDISTAFSSAIETIITVIFSMFGVKLALMISGIASSTLWSVTLGLLAIDAIQGLKPAFSWCVGLFTQLGLLGLLISFSWTRARVQFQRWAVVDG